MNLTNTIIPKSDQLNSDDLISGPRTIRINGVTSGSAEQPVSIHYDSDNGRPYKPCKSMRRVLVTIWGADGTAYVGRRLTIFRDAGVSWGGEAVGGIRISHASDIGEPVQIALTATRGKRKPFRIEPLADDKPNAPADCPPEWADWSNDERGDFMATRGETALKEWWATLDATAKKALKSRLDCDWKPAAIARDAANKS
jgi:hypothetical protein